MKRGSGSTIQSASFGDGHFRVPGAIIEATKWKLPCEILVEWDADLGAIILRRIEDATFRVPKKARRPKGAD